MLRGRSFFLTMQSVTKVAGGRVGLKPDGEKGFMGKTTEPCISPVITT
jgi:hypothetical protein